MSNSILWNEHRRLRTKQKQYENRMHRNALQRKYPLETTKPLEFPITRTTATKASSLSIWQRILKIVRKILRLKEIK